MNETVVKDIITSASSSREGTNIWNGLDTKFYSSDDAGVFKKTIEDFLTVLSKMTPGINTSSINSVLEAKIASPGINENGDFKQAIELGRGLSFHVKYSSAPQTCSLFITQNGANNFELPSLQAIIDLISDFISAEFTMNLPDFIMDLSRGISVQNLTLSLAPKGNPRLMLDLVMSFDGNGAIAKELGIQEIRQSLDLLFASDTIQIGTSLVLSLREVKLFGRPPSADSDMWTFGLVTSKEKVTFGMLLNSIQVGDVENSGIYEFTDNSMYISELAMGIGTSGVEYFGFGIASSFNAEAGSLSFSDPSSILVLVKPFSTRERSMNLGLSFKIGIGLLDSIDCGGSLTRVGGVNTGMIGAQVNGTIRLGDIVDLGDDSKVSVEVSEDLKVEIDLNEVVQVTDPVFSISFEEDKIVRLQWNDDNFIEIGGPKKLDLAVTVPAAELTGGLISTIQVLYTKKGEVTNKKVVAFTTAIKVQGNGIEEGLQFLGDVGQSIIDREQLTVTIKKEKGKNRNKPYFAFPSDIVGLPDPLKIGGDSFVLSNTDYFINPSKPLSFGMQGQLDLDIIGTLVTLSGALAVDPKSGFMGSFGIETNFMIGRNISIQRLAVEFTPPSYGGSADFALYDRTGNFILTMIPGVAGGAPVPDLFEFRYPGELSIGGLIDAFVGDVNIDPALGRIVAFTGSPLQDISEGVTKYPSSSRFGDLYLMFEISALAFGIDARCSLLNGAIEGFIKGKFSVTEGLQFMGVAKSIDLSVIEVTGANEGEDPNFYIVIPGLTNYSSVNPQIYISGKVSCLGLTVSVLVDISDKGLYMAFEGDIFGVIAADIIISGMISTEKSFLRVSATFEQNIRKAIQKNAHAGINSLIGGATGALATSQMMLRSAQAEVDKLEYEINQNRKIVEKEREDAKKDLDSKLEDLKESKEKIQDLKDDKDEMIKVVKSERKEFLYSAERELKKAQSELGWLDKKIAARRKVLERKRQRLEKKKENALIFLTSCQNVVDGLQDSINWHNGEISSYDSKIRSKKSQINKLPWYNIGRAAVYLTSITYYRGRIGLLLVGRGTVWLAMKFSNLALIGAKEAVKGVTRLIQVVVVNADPTLLYHLSTKVGLELALNVALESIKGAQGLVQFVPAELDWRVYKIIVKITAQQGLLEFAIFGVGVAREIYAVFDNLISVDLHPRVAKLIFAKAIATLALTSAQNILETSQDVIEGPIRDAMKYIVDFAVNFVPFDVTRISFDTMLSTADGGTIGLSIEFVFCGIENDIDLEFNFKSLAPADIIVEFAQALAETILGLEEENTARSATMITSSAATSDNPVSPPITKEFLESVKREAEEEDRAFEEEMEIEAIDFDVSKIELKRHLMSVQLNTLRMRESLLEQQKASVEGAQEIMGDVQKIVNGEQNTRINAMRAQGGADVSNAFEKAKDIFMILDQRSQVHEERVQTMSNKIEGIYARISQEEEKDAEVAAALMRKVGTLSEKQQLEEKKEKVAKWNVYEKEVTDALQSFKYDPDKTEKNAQLSMYADLYKNLKVLRSIPGMYRDRVDELTPEINTSEQELSIKEQADIDEARVSAMKVRLSALEDERVDVSDTMAVIYERLEEAETSVWDIQQRTKNFVSVYEIDENLFGTLQELEKNPVDEGIYVESF